MHACGKCGAEFSWNTNRIRHEKTCDGFLRLQCRDCHTLFPDKRSKYRHKGKCTGLQETGEDTSIVINDNSTTTNVYNIAVSPPPLTNPYADVLDFGDTSVQAVIDFIASDHTAQGRLLKAFDCGCLHEELTRLTHFFGPQENRNVLGIESHGSVVKVVHENECIREDCAIVLPSIATRNITISNHPEIRAVLGVEEDGDVLTVAMTTRQRAYETQRIRRVIENGGKYLMSSVTTLPNVTGPKRSAISQRARYGIAASQGWQCNICNDLLTTCFDVDHIVPLCRGGADDTWNMQALCVPCHRQKTVDERTKS